ncbi:TetR/AcrR family transcriptional regulator [Microbacterium rhizophilus]|uniref:TetR/AcrR family transcriptional regulator n=1 Tax=Microbacterium rhizophilus TaxID=3138934 RepID=UPI0031EFACAE
MSAGEVRETRRLTSRGAATRARIIAAADRLITLQGIGATTLADVRLESATSKSQLYQHFEDKDALVAEVVESRGRDVLDHQRRRLSRVRTIEGLEQWGDELVARNALTNGAFGCPLGSLTHELAEGSEQSRQALAGHFRTWVTLIEDALQELARRGVLREDADTRALAHGMLAALQGGYLLAQAARDVYPMRVALDGAIDRVRAARADTGADGEA